MFEEYMKKLQRVEQIKQNMTKMNGVVKEFSYLSELTTKFVFLIDFYANLSSRTSKEIVEEFVPQICDQEYDYNLVDEFCLGSHHYGQHSFYEEKIEETIDLNLLSKYVIATGMEVVSTSKYIDLKVDLVSLVTHMSQTDLNNYTCDEWATSDC